MPSAPAGTALPMKSCSSSAAKRSRTGSRRRFFSTAGASLAPIAISFLLSTMRFSMCSQNSGVSQSGTSGNIRAVVLFVSMMTCLQQYVPGAQTPCLPHTPWHPCAFPHQANGTPSAGHITTGPRPNDAPRTPQCMRIASAAIDPKAVSAVPAGPQPTCCPSMLPESITEGSYAARTCSDCDRPCLHPSSVTEDTKPLARMSCRTVGALQPVPLDTDSALPCAAHGTA